MYRAGRLRRVFRARGKLVGTSDFVVTKGYVQIRVVGFPMGDRLADFFVAQRASYESLWPAAFCREVSDDRDEIEATTLRIVLCVTVGRLCIKGHSRARRDAPRRPCFARLCLRNRRLRQY